MTVYSVKAGIAGMTCEVKIMAIWFALLDVILITIAALRQYRYQSFTKPSRCTTSNGRG